MNIENDAIESYAANGQDGKLMSAINQLKRFYPDENVSEIDNDLIPLVLDRTINYMVHLDQTFSLAKTFDHDHYITMIDQAKALDNWSESEDDTPMPSILSYEYLPLPGEESEIITVEAESSELDEVDGEPAIVADESKPVKMRAARNSKYQNALAIYHEDAASGKPRKDTLARFIELGLGIATANVYYSKFKHNK